MVYIKRCPHIVNDHTEHKKVEDKQEDIDKKRQNSLADACNFIVKIDVL